MVSQKLTALDDYRLLGRSGLRVSPLCLGTRTFGKMNEGDSKADSRKVFDLYIERGGNFIDTANIYANGNSEKLLGEIIASRRDQLVLASKYTGNTRPGDPNAGGNHRKNLIQSIEASLKRLRTDYIDLYWLHMWEFRTPVEEVMRALDDLVRAGKVLYLAISDTPAWKIAQANTIADSRGLTPFIALQAEYNLIERTVERDLIPMAIELNIGVLPWSPLGGGILSGYSKDEQKQQLNEKKLLVVEEVNKLALEIGYSPAQVALNWLVQKPGVVSTTIGARTVKHLEDNLGCLEFILSKKQIHRLDHVSEIDLGFPHNFLASDAIKNLISGKANIVSPNFRD